MKITNEKLIVALKQLDPDLEENWADDGVPKLEAVQALAEDQTLTRNDINLAWPGFDRATAAGAPLPQPEEKHDEDAASSVDTHALLGTLDDEQLRELMLRRVQQAEDAVTEATQARSDAIAAHERALRHRDKLKLEFIRRYPPISVAANIKQHIRKQAEMRAVAAGIDPEVARRGANYTGDQVDQALALRRSRGWARPARPVNNIAGARAAG